MEIKVTIALDDRAHDTLNKLAEAFSQQQTGSAAFSKQEDTAEAPRKAQVATSSKAKEMPDKKANKPETDESAAPVTASASKSKITVEEIRALAADVKTAQGSTKGVKKLLDEYGAENISSIPEDKMAAFAAGLRKLL